jgi:uncharacterized membrane protein YbhN (UPF0104 family)
LLAAGVLLVALPYVVGVDWGQIGRVLGRLSITTMVGLVLLWIIGLWVYTYVMTASLPRLSNWRAFLLNAAGSSVSNILPFGGAAGVAITFAMCRSWGFRNGPVAVSTVVTGVWNILVKLLLPVIGIGALLFAGEVPDKRLGTAAVLGCAMLLGIVAVVVLTLYSEAAAERIQEVLLRLAERMPRRLRQPARRVGGAVLRLRHTTIDVLRTGWAGLSIGMIVYVLLQGALLAACLWATGVMGSGTGFGWAEAVAAFALNRILTTAVVTPAGTGISETGTAALLVHLGAAPAPATAAVLLYMLFTHTLEIPLGGLAGAWWAFTRRDSRNKPGGGNGQASTNTGLAHL